MKKCSICKVEKSLSDFRKNKSMRDGYHYECKSCRYTEKPSQEYIDRRNKKQRDRRKEDIPRCILADSRNSDKKRNRENDLTKQFIEKLISNGCSYCNETNLRMTLDRIDNSKGHTQDNVLPACIRCNYVRRDMPFNAWMLLIEGMRKARDLELFGNWTGAIHKNAAHSSGSRIAS